MQTTLFVMVSESAGSQSVNVLLPDGRGFYPISSWNRGAADRGQRCWRSQFAFERTDEAAKVQKTPGTAILGLHLQGGGLDGRQYTSSITRRFWA